VRDDAKKVIQAKYRGNETISNDAVQEVIAQSVSTIVVITKSTFRPGAEELARIHSVELVDGKLLRLRVQEVLGKVGRRRVGVFRLGLN